MKQDLAKMTDELDLLVAEGEDKVKAERNAIESALEAKKDAIDEDVEARIIVIHAETQRNIESMKAAAEAKKRALDKKSELKVDSVKTMAKTGKILALEKKIRAKEDALLAGTALLDFFKKNDKTGDFLKGGSRLRMTVEELKAAAAEDLRDKSKMPNGEPYPDLPWFRDGTGRLGPVGWDEPRQNPGCPYSPTELAYRAAAAAAAEQDA